MPSAPSRVGRKGHWRPVLAGGQRYAPERISNHKRPFGFRLPVLDSHRRSLLAGRRDRPSVPRRPGLHSLRITEAAGTPEARLLPYAACWQPLAFSLRVAEGGNLASLSAGRIGRRKSSPPQFGQRPFSTPSAHVTQKVHSNEQITASRLAGGRSRSQHSQLGRSSSMDDLAMVGGQNHCPPSVPAVKPTRPIDNAHPARAPRCPHRLSSRRVGSRASRRRTAPVGCTGRSTAPASAPAPWR